MKKLVIISKSIMIILVGIIFIGAPINLVYRTLTELSDKAYANVILLNYVEEIITPIDPENLVKIENEVSKKFYVDINQNTKKYLNDQEDFYGSYRSIISKYNGSNILELANYANRSKSVSFDFMDSNYRLYDLLDNLLNNTNTSECIRESIRLKNIGILYKNIIQQFYFWEIACLFLLTFCYYMIKTIEIEKRKRTRLHDKIIIAVLFSSALLLANSIYSNSWNQTIYQDLASTIHTVSNTDGFFQTIYNLFKNSYLVTLTKPLLELSTIFILLVGLGEQFLARITDTTGATGTTDTNAIPKSTKVKVRLVSCKPRKLIIPLKRSILK